MGELTELIVDRRQPIPFQHEGRPLKARPMPLRLALKLNEPNEAGEVTMTASLMADIIAECVVFEDGTNAFTSQQILDGDSDLMIPLFKSITDLFNPEEAEKN